MARATLPSAPNRSGSGRFARAAHVAFAALLLAACTDVERPNVPLPRLAMRGQDGAPLSRESLLGRPWVIALWVPG